MKRLLLLVRIAVLSGAAVGCGQQAPKNTAPPAWTADYAGQSGAADGGKAWQVEPVGGRASADPPSMKAEATTSMDKPMGGTAAPPAMTPKVVGEPRSGAAIAISADDSLALAVNRDVGSVSLFALEFDREALKTISLRKELQLEPGSEPYQVVIAPDNETAYLVLRRDQFLVKLGSLGGEPKVLERVAVGSEPTAVALNGDGSRAYVTNWNDGTLSVVETSSMKLVRTVDLNAALVAGGYLGEMQPRAALAHPRSVAVGDGVLFVTEFFAQQIEAEQGDGSNADTHKVGVVYKITLPDWNVSTLQLSALPDMVFRDDKRGQAGCYPNQLQSLAVNSQFVYVVSVCASPEGPLGVKLTTTTCTAVTDCPAGMVEPACITPFAGAANQVCADVASVKTTTAPVISILDASTGRELPSGGVNLNARFDALYKLQQTDAAKQRFPLFASEIAFVPGTTVGYVSANGSDAVFRFQTDAMSGEIESVGATTNAFIDLNPAGVPADKAGKNPIGIAIARQHKKVALVANEVTRNVSALDFNTQALSGGVMQPKAATSASLPVPGSTADQILRGKRFFNTGTGRWSLRGQGWGACQSCHADGLSDNVTWYFARGPRQSTSLDGSFASTHPDDQRLFNWTAINDEVADFELNTRGVSGGVGAIVSDSAVPLATSQRIDFQGLGQAALNGSAKSAADPANPLQLAAAPKLADWNDIEKYMQSIRSPRAPTSLDKAKVEQGRMLFNEEANCQGCHGGEKWTVSRRFYTPSTASNTALLTTPLASVADFPTSLLPSRQSAKQTLRFQGDNVAALDQILCVLRPVGTYNLAESGVGIAEVRADMTTAAQGGGDTSGDGSGYNVPSLLGVSTGAPFLHAGNARTLESLFSERFSQHHQALAANFLTENDEAERVKKVSALVQYLLSIDEQAAYPALPGTGASGGSLCPQSF